MTLARIENPPQALMSAVSQLDAALALAEDAYELIDIRNDAQRMAVISAAAGFKELHLRFSKLVRLAEVEYVEKNPPMKPQEKGELGMASRWGIVSSQREPTIKPEPVTENERKKLTSAYSDTALARQVIREADDPDDLSRRVIARKIREIKQDIQPVKEVVLPQGKYGVILADPPWRYGDPVTENRAIENQYPTMTLEEIKALDVPALTLDKAVLYLWATSPKLPEAIEVMKAWGFSYKSSWVWIKESIGMGFWGRIRHELVLIGTKGGFNVPLPEVRPDSVIEAKRGRHSEKPAEVYERLERIHPDQSKVELFARGQRDGWAVWGNEVDE